MYYKLIHVQQFGSSSDVVLLRFYAFQRKEDGPEFTIWVSSYDKCPWISSPEITKYKNIGYLI